ncbi:MAG: hypothetical protein U5L10_04115 [Candidatus Moranbacteria bacterium]|nr:hypothetical protein [Candidatus Moranbacteria bacterium]
MKKIITILVVFGLFAGVGLVMAGKGNENTNSKKEKCTTIQSGEIESSTGEVLTTGYDEYGYNYQAHMFNGWYDNYLRPEVIAQGGTKLMMKWNDAWLSNKDCDGDGLLDRHLGYDSYIGSGAWLTNHMSGEYEGEDGKKCKWTYFTKIVAAPEDAYNSWNVEGDWVINAHGNSHNMTITSQDSEGNFEGYGNYQNGPQEWKIEDGKVDGDQISMNWVYSNSSYEAYFEGTINSKGNLEGTFDDTSGHVDYAWESEEGVAEKYWYAEDGTEIGLVIWGQFATIQTVSNDTCGGEHGVQYLSPARAGLGNW